MNPTAKSNEILVQELEKELLIYNLKINKAFSLNETCAVVWRECDGKRTTQEIATILNRETDGLVNEEVVWLALDTLRKENLLEESFEMNSKFNGMNRREVIRKVGFASMVAIPLVTSLFAPTAANAQSSSPAPCGAHNPGEAWLETQIIIVLDPNLCPSICVGPPNAVLTSCQDILPQPIANPDFHEISCEYACPAA